MKLNDVCTLLHLFLYRKVPAVKSLNFEKLEIRPAGE